MGNNIYLFNKHKTMKFFALALIATASAVTIRGDFFEARDNGTGPLDKKYERVLPVQFADASDDLFMRSMIMNYAREAKNEDGTPNGVFDVAELQARKAATEVVGTHLKLEGKALGDYIETYFPRTWAHYDVNKVGSIPVETMPLLMRFLASDQYL